MNSTTISKYQYIVTTWMNCQPIDLRIVSRQWLRKVNLDFYTYKKEERTYINNFFSPVDDLPVEVLWIYISVMFEGETVGYSITKHEGWHKLNVYFRGERSYTDRDLREQERALFRLDAAGYITFLAAGSVWEIRRTAKAA